MLDPGDPRVKEAAAEADRLAIQVEASHGLQPIYDRLDSLIESVESEGQRAEDLLPMGVEPGLGFSLRQKRDGRTLWAAVAQAGRDRLCDPEGEVSKLLSGKSGHAGTAALIGSVLVALGLSAMALPIATAVVALILASGLKGFCEWTASPADEPARA